MGDVKYFNSCRDWLFKIIRFNRLKIKWNQFMSGDNLLSQLPVKFYSDEMTETKKIIYLERKFRELDEFIENVPEVA
jgi:hypothetical protein